MVNEEPEDDDSDHEMKSDDDEDQEEEDMEEKAWKWLLERVYKTMDFSTEQRTSTEILRTKVALKDIASRLRDEVEDMIKFGVYLHDESPLYQKVTNTKNKLMDEEDYDEDEATVKAWKNRKFVAYQQIKENDDILIPLSGAPRLLGDINLVESIQRAFTRRLPHPADMSYRDRLEHFGLESTELRHLKADLLMAFKIVYGHCDLDFAQFYQFASNEASVRTRSSATLNMAKPQLKRGLALYRYSFVYRTIALWNSLPASAQFSPSLNHFSTQLNQNTPLLDQFIKGRALCG